MSTLGICPGPVADKLVPQTTKFLHLAQTLEQIAIVVVSKDEKIFSIISGGKSSKLMMTALHWLYLEKNKRFVLSSGRFQGNWAKVYGGSHAFTISFHPFCSFQNKFKWSHQICKDGYYAMSWHALWPLFIYLFFADWVEIGLEIYTRLAKSSVLILTLLLFWYIRISDHSQPTRLDIG